jgi:RNA polymerase sigma factor (sigma-70 family)
MNAASPHRDLSTLDRQADDWRLLRRYVDFNSEEAFSELVGRHLSWIHATCRKALRDRQMAEDAAQAVFIILARRAATITPQTRLSGWLFNTARFVVKDALKQQARYRRREEVARELATERMSRHSQTAAEPHAQAALEDALATLTERDRQALLMHFYEGLSLSEMAEVLEIGKEGVKKRVARALGRLRARLGSKRSGVMTLIAVALLLRSRAASALPMGLESSVISGVMVPGQASVVAQWMAAQAMRLAAGASGRLLRAALAAELVAAVTVVGVWTMPSAKHPAAAVPTAAQSVAVSSPVEKSNRTIAQPMALQSPRQPAAATASNEPPYHSGADDPEPQVLPLARGEAPRKVVKAAPTAVAAASETPGRVMDNSVYAGVPPVARAAVVPGLPMPPDGRRSVLLPVAPLDVGARPAVASAPPERGRAIRENEATASSARPASAATDDVVGRCLSLLTPADAARRAADHATGMDEPSDGFWPNHGPGGKAGLPPLKVALGNSDAGYFSAGAGGDLRRMFVEQGDNYDIRGSRPASGWVGRGGLHPFVTRADDQGDRMKLIGGWPKGAVDCKELRDASDTAERRHGKGHGSSGLCSDSPIYSPPLNGAAASIDFMAAAPGSFQAVPEPGPAATVAAALLLSAALRRRRPR